MTKLPKRPESHQLASKSHAYLLTCMPKSWNVVEFPVQNDYGIDYFVEVFEREVPNGSVFVIQCKAISGRRTSQAADISFSWPVSNILYLLDKRLKTLLVLFNDAQHRAYWLWLDRLLIDKTTAAHPRWRSQSTVSLQFPVRNILSPSILVETVSSEYWSSSPSIDETVMRLTASEHRDVFKVLQDIGAHDEERDLESFTSSLGCVNELLKHDIVCIYSKLIPDGHYSSRSELVLKLTPRGAEVARYVRKYKSMIDEAIRKFAEASACMG